MQQHDLKPPPGAKKARRRVGRGDSSGYGSYAGRGVKGQKSRSGGGVRLGFEGGQLPLSKKLPSIRGFTNIFRTEYAVVNLHDLEGFGAGSAVDPAALADAGAVKNLKRPIKVLGRGEVHAALNVSAHKFSAAARRKIEAAGGSAREIA